MTELALLDRSQIFLFVLTCHRCGLRVLFFVDDLVVVGSSAVETLLMYPVVVGMSRAVGIDRPPLLSLPPPPVVVPAAFSLPSADSGPAAPAADSDPALDQSLRAVRRSLRSQQRALRDAGRALARLDALAVERSMARLGVLVPAPTLFLQPVPAVATQTSPSLSEDDSWNHGWDSPPADRGRRYSE
jgi:hypothetical protein